MYYNFHSVKEKKKKHYFIPIHATRFFFKYWCMDLYQCIAQGVRNMLNLTKQAHV